LLLTEDRCVRRSCAATRWFVATDGHYFVQKYKLPRTIAILRTLFSDGSSPDNQKISANHRPGFAFFASFPGPVLDEIGKNQTTLAFLSRKFYFCKDKTAIVYF